MKQLEVLRAFGALGSTGRAASNMDVSKLVNIHNSTVGLITPFFVDIGLLRRTPEGFTPADEVVKFSRSHQWSPETAGHRLAPVIGRAWFADPIISRLRFSPLSEDEATRELAVIASAGPTYKSQLENLLDYLHASGLVTKENGQLRTAQRGAAAEPEAVEETKVTAMTTDPPAGGRSMPPLATVFAHDAAGVVQFNISVKVDMTEFGTWEPTRIAAFFGGIAQVLAAKANVEKQQATGP